MHQFIVTAKRRALLGLVAVVALGLIGTGCQDPGEDEVIQGRQRIVIELQAGLEVAWTQDRWTATPGTSGLSPKEVETALASLRAEIQKTGFAGPRPMFPEDLTDAEAARFLVLSPPADAGDAEVRAFLDAIRGNPLIKSAEEQGIPQLAN